MHDDLEGEILAVKGDVLGGFGEVSAEIASGVDAGFFKDDAERAALLGIAENAGACHAEGLCAEGIRAIISYVAAVRVGLCFCLAGGDIGSAKDLEGFEEGGQRNLETRKNEIVFIIGLGGVEDVVGKQRLAQACDAYCWSATLSEGARGSRATHLA